MKNLINQKIKEIEKQLQNFEKNLWVKTPEEISNENAAKSEKASTIACEQLYPLLNNSTANAILSSPFSIYLIFFTKITQSIYKLFKLYY